MTRQFLTNCQLMENQNLVISFDYSWFLAKNLPPSVQLRSSDTETHLLIIHLSLFLLRPMPFIFHMSCIVHSFQLNVVDASMEIVSHLEIASKSIIWQIIGKIKGATGCFILKWKIVNGSEG